MVTANLCRILFLLSLTLFLSSSATADPISLTGTGSPNPNCPFCAAYIFSLTNLSNSISMSISTANGVTPMGGMAGPGQGFFLDFRGSGFDAVGSLTVDGVTYPAFAGLRFNASPVFAPLTPPGPVGSSFSFSSFVFFTGEVFACDTPVVQQCLPLFRVDLIGSGRIDVTARILDNGGQPIYRVTNATYTLTTPEPSSLVLFVSGLLGFGRYVRRINRKDKNY